MNHHDDKIKAQLINELDGMRQRVEALESLAIKGGLTEVALATHKNQVDAPGRLRTRDAKRLRQTVSPPSAL